MYTTDLVASRRVDEILLYHFNHLNAPKILTGSDYLSDFKIVPVIGEPHTTKSRLQKKRVRVRVINGLLFSLA